MTETQGWIVIGLLVLILGQLVIVGLEMSGLRRELTSGLNKLFQNYSETLTARNGEAAALSAEKDTEVGGPFYLFSGLLSRSGSLAIGAAIRRAVGLTD
jgi:hypothetical protein